MTENVTSQGYEAPAVVKLGSIAELTQTNTYGGAGSAFQSTVGVGPYSHSY
jgi:hypothetical protein